MPHERGPIVVGVTGASGSVLANRLVDALLRRETDVALVCSSGGRLVWAEEMDRTYAATVAGWEESPYFTEYAIGDLRAPIASGSYPTRGMALVPCSMNSLSAIAHGRSDNLLLRAADVCLKERRTLVVTPRETPCTPATSRTCCESASSAPSSCRPSRPSTCAPSPSTMLSTSSSTACS